MKKWTIAKNRKYNFLDAPAKDYLEFQSGSVVGFDTKELAVEFCKTVLGMSDAEIEDLHFEEVELPDEDQKYTFNPGVNLT